MMTRVRVKPVSERSAAERRADAQRLEEMFAARQPPGTKGTDRAFMEDRHNGKQFENQPGMAEKYRKIAKRAGVSVAGKVYHAGIARRPGDPAAWISDTSELLSRCKQLGKSCTGIVEYQAPEREAPESKPLAPDIVNRLMHDTILKDQSKELAVRIKTGKQSLRDLREDVIAKHALKRKKSVTQKVLHASH